MSLTAVPPTGSTPASEKENREKRFLFLDGFPSRSIHVAHPPWRKFVPLLESRLWFSHPVLKFAFISSAGGNQFVFCQAAAQNVPTLLWRGGWLPRFRRIQLTSTGGCPSVSIRNAFTPRETTEGSEWGVVIRWILDGNGNPQGDGGAA